MGRLEPDLPLDFEYLFAIQIFLVHLLFITIRFYSGLLHIFSVILAIWAVPVGVALGITVAYIALLMMFNHVVKIPYFQALYEEEIREFIRTIIIIVGGYLILNLSLLVFSFFVDPYYRPFFDLSILPADFMIYTAQVISKKAAFWQLEYFMSLSSIEVIINIFSSGMVSTADAGQARFKFTPSKFIPMLNGFIFPFKTSFTATLGFYSVVSTFLGIYRRYLFFQFFLPLGILLRAIPLTRKLGSSILSLAFAIYLGLPAGLAISSPLLENAYVGVPSTYEILNDLQKKVEIPITIPLHEDNGKTLRQQIREMEDENGISGAINNPSMAKALGLIDENGNPLSPQDYNKYVEEQRKEAFKEASSSSTNVLKIAGVIITSLVATIVSFFYKKVSFAFGAVIVMLSLMFVPTIIKFYVWFIVKKVLPGFVLMVAVLDLSVVIQILLTVGSYRMFSKMFDGIDTLFGLQKLGLT